MLKRRGFTLIEVLLVLGILAILASIVIIAINPGRQMAQARNTQRWSNVNTIINAIHQYSIDNNGNLPSNIGESYNEICATPTVASTSCGMLTNLWVITDHERYIIDFPVDPSYPVGCDTNGTCYQVKKSADGRIYVSAPKAELGKKIEVKR